MHIADVSHYVKPGTALDDEAAKRGNSTYLVDRVIPMLPEALSNELCSLKPDVDRLTKCVEFLLADDGRVLKRSSTPAVIHSQRRFTYQEVFAILQQPPSGRHRADAARRPRAGPEDPPRSLQGRLARPRFPETENPPRRRRAAWRASRRWRTTFRTS